MELIRGSKKTPQALNFWGRKGIFLIAAGGAEQERPGKKVDR
jgi:hypothetical protein